jgi:hypothetical protein
MISNASPYRQRREEIYDAAGMVDPAIGEPETWTPPSADPRQERRALRHRQLKKASTATPESESLGSKGKLKSRTIIHPPRVEHETGVTAKNRLLLPGTVKMPSRENGAVRQP